MSALEYKQRGNDAFRRKQYSEAEQLYTRGLHCIADHATRDTPLDTTAADLLRDLHFNRARCYFQLGTFHLAFTEVFMTRAYLHGSNDLSHHRTSLTFAAKVNQRRAFRHVYEALIRPHPDFTDAISQSLGRMYAAHFAGDDDTPNFPKPAGRAAERGVNSVHNRTAVQERNMEVTLADHSRPSYRYPLGANPQLQQRLAAIERPPAEGTALSDTAVVRRSPLHRYGVFATRAVREGEVLWTELPAFWACVSEERCQWCCAACAGQHATCPHCRTERYCNDECRARAWADHHQLMCQHGWQVAKRRAHIREQGFSMSSRGQLMIMQILSRSFDSRRGVLGDIFALHPTLCDLTTAGGDDGSQLCGDLESGIMQYAHLLSACALSNVDVIRFDYATFDHLRMTLSVNNYGLYSEQEHERGELGFGSGCYRLSSFVNHSCLPNVVWSTSSSAQTGHRFVATANTNIAAGDELCVSYIAASMDLEQRRNALVMYAITCQCPLCVAQEQAPGMIERAMQAQLQA